MCNLCPSQQIRIPFLSYTYAKSIRKLIYTQNLQTFIQEIIAQCPVCIITQPKKLRRLCGDVRSNIFLPGECIEIDSCYLPSDRYQHSKALIIVDACSSKVSIFPGRDLKSATIRQHMKNFLYCNPLPRVVRCDFGQEHKKDLDVFLAQYSIQLEASQPYP